MNYEKFKEQFVEDVKQAFQDKVYDNVNIALHKVEKMNESYDAITITHEGSNIGMNLNIEKFFESYENGVNYDEIVFSAIDTYEKNMVNAPSIDVEMLDDYEQMKGKLCMDVVSVERNTPNH